MHDFVTVFEIAGGNTAIPWLSRPAYLAIGSGALCLGAIMTVVRLIPITRFRIKRFVPIFIIVWGVGWLGFAPVILSMHRRADALYEDYQMQRYEMVEGTVEVIRTQPAEGHAPGDLVRIGDKEFVVNFFLSTPAYRWTLSHGGDLKDGVYARVFHTNGNILRVDIKARNGQSGPRE